MKIDYDLTNILISSIVAGITIITAIIYLLTLNEIKKQRENTYSPHLFIDNSTFYVSYTNIFDINFPCNWNDLKLKKVLKNKSKHLYPNPIFFLKCYNIGFGTSKNISVTFNYNIEDFLSTINFLQREYNKDKKKIQLGITSSMLSDSNFPHQCFHFNKNIDETFLTVCFDLNKKYNTYLSYILPVSVSKEATLLEIPKDFLNLLNLYMYELKKDVLESKYIDKIPNFYVTIEYFDITNKLIKEKTTIKTILKEVNDLGFIGEFVIEKPI